MTEIVTALAFGFGFGFLLHKAGLTHYARIVNVYRLSDLTVMVFMLSALFVGAVVIQAGGGLGLADVPLAPPTSWRGNLTGGVVFGIGMASAGYCPGTIVAEAGEGRLDAFFAGLTGLLSGALLFGLLQPLIMPTLGNVGSHGRKTLPELLGVSPWLLLFVCGEVAVLTLLWTGKRRAKS